MLLDGDGLIPIVGERYGFMMICIMRGQCEQINAMLRSFSQALPTSRLQSMCICEERSMEASNGVSYAQPKTYSPQSVLSNVPTVQCLQPPLASF